MENDLYIRMEKCKQKVREVGFLKVVLGLEGIKINKEKVEGILNWPTPKEVKDVQKFLGLANYYYQFIKDFAAIARPLHDMVKKDQKQEWTERQEKAFRELKEIYKRLVVLDLDKKK